MKNLKLHIVLLLLTILAACSEDDKLTVITQDTVTRGAVIRTVSFESSSFNVFDPNSFFGVTLEEQDIEDGALLSDIDIYVDFVDNSSSNGTTSSTETLVTNVPAASFTDGPNSLPRTSFTITLSEALSTLGIANDPANITGGDEINIRMALNLTDGRSFTDVDGTGNVTGGSFFSSPFAYRAGINCVPITPVVGDYTLDLEDSFGDGWDGAFITATIDGNSTDYTIDSGANAVFVVTVPPGAAELIFSYTAGSFESEHSYTILAPSGAVAAADGPGPAPGDIVLNICF